MKKLEQTRREFCALACRAVSAAALVGTAGAVLEGCGGGGPTSPSGLANLATVNGTVGNSAITVAIDASSPLAAVGGAALLQSSIGTFLIARTAQDSFSVLTGICTHQRCTITGFASGRFVCPCHGSNFSTSGTVLNGPAVIALRQFPSSFANGVLTFTT